jgi:hypothetical protein
MEVAIAATRYLSHPAALVHGPSSKSWSNPTAFHQPHALRRDSVWTTVASSIVSTAASTAFKLGRSRDRLRDRHSHPTTTTALPAGINMSISCVNFFSSMTKSLSRSGPAAPFLSCSRAPRTLYVSRFLFLFHALVNRVSCGPGKLDPVKYNGVGHV